MLSQFIINRKLALEKDPDTVYICKQCGEEDIEHKIVDPMTEDCNLYSCPPFYIMEVLWCTSSQWKQISGFELVLRKARQVVE